MDTSSKNEESWELGENPVGVQKTLRELKLNGLVTHSPDKVKRVYHLTKVGRRVFETIEKAREKLNKLPKEVEESLPQKLGV